MTDNDHSEPLRKLLHISMAGFALFLRWLPWWLAAVLAGVALFLNTTWIPRAWGDRLVRPEDRGGVLRSGIALYALSVLVLILLYRNHLEVAACGWGVLAFGDGAATLLGRGMGGRRLPWNLRKSWMGSIGFLGFGTLGATGLMWWVARRSDIPPLAISTAFLLSLCAALVGAVIESLPLELNDNLSVPLLSAGLVFSLQQIDPSVWTASRSHLLRNLWLGLVLNLVFALGARAMGTISWSGVVGGMAIGTPIATFTGWRGFLVLAAFFFLGSAATRLGYLRKAARGIAQERGGARGAVHAVANGSVAAFLAFLAGSTVSPLREALFVAFVASLATATCDTLGSEIGPLGRTDPFLITRLRRVAAGTPGAVSLLGTVAGAAGALLVATAAVALGLIPLEAVGVVVVAALFGALLESLLGATLEPRGLISSETINFVNTLAGALAALGLIRFSGGLT